MKNKFNQSGQVAIVILLIMVVLSTVGLSLASRTTQEVFLSQQEAQSARVFNAAEVGLEDALSQDFDSISAQNYNDSTTVSGVDINTSINLNNVLETNILEGNAVHIDLKNYNGNFTVNWSRETTCDPDVTTTNTASILVSVYYDDGGTTKVIHDAFGPCTRSPDDQFTISGVRNGSNGYQKKTIDLSAGPGTSLFARVRPVYADTAVRITGSVDFPTQFFVIRSQADNVDGDENRTVEVGRTLSASPSFMDYSLYSGAGINIQAEPTP